MALLSLFKLCPGMLARAGIVFVVGALASASFANEPAIDPSIGAPLTVRERPVFGSADAEIVVIEVRSFKCAHCRAFHETVFPQLREKYIATNQLRWVRINASPDPADKPAAVFAIARCAMQQGTYESIEDFLFRYGNRASSFLQSRVAEQPGIDRNALANCLRTDACRAEIEADFAEAAALKVTVLPTFILRKKRADGSFVEARIEGYPQEDYFTRVLDGLRAQP